MTLEEFEIEIKAIERQLNIALMFSRLVPVRDESVQRAEFDNLLTAMSKFTRNLRHNFNPIQ